MEELCNQVVKCLELMKEDGDITKARVLGNYWKINKYLANALSSCMTKVRSKAHW